MCSAYASALAAQYHCTSFSASYQPLRHMASSSMQRSSAPHTAKAAPQAGTSGACGAAFCIYETEENAQRSAPLERMTF